MVDVKELEVGDILICKGKSWISKAIMKVTKGQYSHSALYATAWKQPGVIEAQAKGVSFKLWRKWRDKWDYDYIAFRYNKPFSEKDLMLRAFEKSGETKYDWFTFFIQIPFRLFTNKSRFRKNKTKQDDRQICSEFCAYVWDLPQKEITPEELYNYLVASDDWKIIK